jgi:hypothetical protein
VDGPVQLVDQDGAEAGLLELPVDVGRVDEPACWHLVHQKVLESCSVIGRRQPAIWVQQVAVEGISRSEPDACRLSCAWTRG